MHILWTRLGEPEKAEAMLERDVKTVGAASPGGLIHYADSYASALGRYDRASDLYEQALASQDLRMLCKEEDDCVAWHALSLVRTERALGNDRAADEWLKLAEKTIGSEEVETPANAEDNRSSLSDAMLLIARRRYAEAVGMLRQIAFDWDAQGGQDLELPIYLLENAALFDPLRDMPEFQQLLDDYNAWLEPMRLRVLEAQRSGNWEALRQRTYQWAHQSTGQSASGG
jgi:tetratricopeptide (TPR) repeat protein